MGAFSLGIRQIYGGLKTMFGYGAKAAAKTATKAEKVYHGPSLIDMVKRQPLALPAPSAKQLAADVPQVMVPKVLGGKNLNELRMTQEILADGSHVRYFRGKDSDKILIKMKDHGRLHQEWINSDKGKIYIKTTGNGDRYVAHTNGNYTQIEKRAVKYKDGMDQTISTNDLYYNDHNGNGIHIQQAKGFNGEETASCDVLGSIKENQTINGKKSTYQVDYGAKAKGPYQGGRTRLDLEHAPKDRLSIIDTYHRYGDRIGDKAYTKVQELLNSAKERFIPDIDEAFFKPYKMS